MTKSQINPKLQNPKFQRAALRAVTMACGWCANIRWHGFVLRFCCLGFGIYLGFGILGFGICERLTAQSAPSALGQIYANLGNISSSGLPQIRIPLGHGTELARYGFTFAMTHNVVPGYNGSARSEWRITGLRTCVHLDDNGDLVWVRPNLQQIVFKKADNYRQERLGWTAVARNGAGDVELAGSTGQKWSYKGGFLREIADRFAVIDFVTDQETVLLASRRDRAGNEVVLMRAEYSDAGLLARLELGQAPPVIFHWSGAAVLAGIEGLPAGGMTFDYENMLLREWDNNGARARTNYTWVSREGLAKNISFGIAPVRLQGDSEFRYEYDTNGDANILRVFRRDGSFVSETRFGSRGIIQKVGDKTIRATFRNVGTSQ